MQKNEVVPFRILEGFHHHKPVGFFTRPGFSSQVGILQQSVMQL